jgi:protein TonB
MKIKSSIKAACASVLALLSACGHQAPVASYPVAQSASRAPVSQRGVLSGQRTAFDSVDIYKYDVAEQIMRYNGAHTFSGKLPPMLPAIVVLTITVDHTGKATKVAVQRSRDNDASKVALASMQRAGALPRPFNLATGPGRSLTFSETFLFNADYRFQLRTLAPIQTSD